MLGFLRLLLGIALLPACWGMSRVFIDVLPLAAGSEGLFSAEALSLLGGVLAFVALWLVMPHPVRTYVLGHELTHALWGLFFGARPGKLRVGANGGSVNLTKTNLLITLAPYFFPFYTFVVIVIAMITKIAVSPKPLPYLPLWLFMIGLTWSFHALFTIDTLGEKQPDIRTYGRIFSWVFIFLANLVLILVWLASATQLTFAELASSAGMRLVGAYTGIATSVAALCRSLMEMVK